MGKGNITKLHRLVGWKKLGDSYPRALIPLERALLMVHNWKSEELLWRKFILFRIPVNSPVYAETFE